MIRPAPMFDDLHPLSSHVPLAPCVEDPFFEEVRAALGDPALVDERVVDLPPADGPVVAGDVVDPPEFDPDDPATYPCAAGGDCGCDGTGALTCPGRPVDVAPTAALSLVRPSRAVRPPARSRRSPAVAS